MCCVEVNVNALFRCISSSFFYPCGCICNFCITPFFSHPSCLGSPAVLWSWLVVFVSPFRQLTVQNVKMCWNLSHSGVEVSRQLDIPSTKFGEGAQYLFLYLSSSCSSLPCICLPAVLLKHLISLFHSLIQRQCSLLGHHSLAFFFFFLNIYI